MGANGRFVRWNDAFAAICGANDALAQNRSARDFFEEFLGTSEPLRHPEDSGQLFAPEYAVKERERVQDLCEQSQRRERIG